MAPLSYAGLLLLAVPAVVIGNDVGAPLGVVAGGEVPFDGGFWVLSVIVFSVIAQLL